MNVGSLAYVLPLYFTTLIALILGFVAWQRRDVPGARMVVVLMAAVVTWSLGYALEMGAPDLAEKLFWAKVQYAGIVAAPVAFLFFVFVYLGVDDRIHWSVAVINMIVPLVTLAAVWTNEEHHLVWRVTKLNPPGGYPGLYIEHGSVFWICVLYSYIVLLIGAYYIVQSMQSTNYFRRRQAGILLGAVFFPWLGNALYQFNLTPVPGLDLTPISFGMTGILVAYGLVQYHFLDVVPIARNHVLETLADAMVVLDIHNRIIDINPTAQKQLGLASLHEIMALPAATVLPIWPQIVASLDDEARGNIRITTRAPLPERIYDATVTPVLDSTGMLRGRVFLLHDTTQQEQDAEALRHNEGRLRSIVQQLKELDEMKTRFIRSINHELRTPLTNISLYVSLLKAKPDSVARYLQVLEKETAALQRLIEQTLDLAKISQTDSAAPLSLSEVDFSALLESLLPSFTRQANLRSIHLSSVISAQRVILLGDLERLTQCITDLVTNAINYTPNGGEVCLALTLEGRDAHLAVSDSGIGISPAEMPHIFERFFRGEHASTSNLSGLGLGLALAKQTAEMHDGRITVKSAVGKGSIFHLHLPLKSATIAPLPTEDEFQAVPT